MKNEEIEKLWQEYWQTEGIRFLAEGNRVPTPEERSKHAFYTAITLITLDLLIPTGGYIAAIEFTEQE